MIYRVNQATVSRWLTNAREAVLSDVRRELRTMLALDSADVESYLRAARSDLDLGISSFFRATD